MCSRVTTGSLLRDHSRQAKETTCGAREGTLGSCLQNKDLITRISKSNGYGRDLTALSPVTKNVVILEKQISAEAPVLQIIKL